MEITEVKIHIVGRSEPVAKADSRVLATAKIRLDDKFYLNDIRICQANNRMCIEFVRNPYSVHQNHAEYTVVPVSLEARQWIEEIILKTYREKVIEMKKIFDKRKREVNRDE